MTTYKRGLFQGISSSLQTDMARKLDKDIFRSLTEQDDNLGALLDAGLNFDENFDSVYVSFTSSATPNAENTVAHTLGKVPTGFIVVDKNKAAHLYRNGTTATKTNIYLKSDVASVAFTILVF